MTDVLTPEQRSRNMSAIRSKNTGPELALRQMLRDRGVPYRVHAAKLPGKPDLVFTKLRKAIFVHGCYWHMHRCRYGRVVAKTNENFWREKRRSNVERDRRTLRSLRAEGWDVLVVWECWLRTRSKVERRLSEFFSPSAGG
jgi:DNA mismatch endonuclease (patch repair protein)